MATALSLLGEAAPKAIGGELRLPVLLLQAALVNREPDWICDFHLGSHEVAWLQDQLIPCDLTTRILLSRQKIKVNPCKPQAPGTKSDSPKIPTALFFMPSPEVRR